MFRRFKLIDILLAVLTLITILFFFFAPNLFTFTLWLLIAILTIRIMIFLKRKLLWKTRNRLIFSGLFFVITPIVLITIFFLFIIYIIIAQYGVVIVENLIKRQLSQYENSVERYLVLDNAEEMKMRTAQWTRFNPRSLAVAFFEKNEGSYRPFFSYPDDFNFDKMKINQFSGYYKINNTLYLGVLRKAGNFAALISLAVNQSFLDQLSTVSDFKMRFVKFDQFPGQNQNTREITEMASDGEEVLFLPWPYKFDYIDFDQVSGEIVEKEHLHWLLIDYEKIFQKIQGFESQTGQINIQKFIYFLIGLFATFIIISFFIGFRIIRVITRSINLITQGTQKIRRGDFSFRIKIKSGDQLQYLAESFNEMASGIKRLLVEEKEKQRLEEELRIARSIQLKLLPEEHFETAMFEIAAINIPAEEIAGDYFDYFFKDGEYLWVLVADVSGKGTSAAFYMAVLKGMVNYLQKKEMHPAALIAECHESMSHTFDKVTFITINLAQLRIRENKFVFTRAGHTPAIYYDSKKDRCIELNPEGSAIGLPSFERANVQEVEVQYHSGDILFMFSDGLSEIMDEEDEMLGMENLRRLIQEHHALSAREIKQKILDFSIDFSESKVNRDDLTFIILKVK